MTRNINDVAGYQHAPQPDGSRGAPTPQQSRPVGSSRPLDRGECEHCGRRTLGESRGRRKHACCARCQRRWCRGLAIRVALDATDGGQCE